MLYEANLFFRVSSFCLLRLCENQCWFKNTLKLSGWFGAVLKCQKHECASAPNAGCGEIYCHSYKADSLQHDGKF